MKKYSTSILLLFFACQLSATTFFDQLCSFNFNWKKYELQSPTGEARHFNSDKEYIQAHLECVLAILRSNPVEQLNETQYNSRMHLIDVLADYRSRGIFPMNYYRAERTPVFIDEHNTHCAVGYLLQQSGHDDIARRISFTYNYSWLKDINDPELPSWQEASGFSMEELKLIQGGYFSYREDAFIAVDKYEIPQKPVAKIVYFQNEALNKPMAAKEENIWIKGEGMNGVLNGKWVQNYSPGMPWIVGYYENGQRTGQWEEYFQGTKQLCRNENWRNNKLNGLRRRFDKFGNLIEEIMFKDGNAVKKTNYSLGDSLTYVRKPIDSTLVFTEVYNFEGSLIACGQEKIYNPGNLLWFQNIELTALNYASVSARGMSTANQSDGNSAYYRSSNANLFNTMPLVQYKKEGDWIYYKEYAYAVKKSVNTMRNSLAVHYRHFGPTLLFSTAMFEDVIMNSAYDSIRVEYADDNLQNFYGYGATSFVHYQVSYYTASEIPPRINLGYYGYSYPYGHQSEETLPPVIKEFGQLNQANEKIGEWKHFTKNSKLYKTENYLIAWKPEDEK
jgi:antitoxin component YwqK of YwqJK toxin-antitoxin module